MGTSSGRIGNKVWLMSVINVWFKTNKRRNTMKTHKTIFVLALALTIALAACSNTTGVPDLEGTSWLLLEINGQPVLEGSDPTLVFESESVGGDGSCNVFGGEYEIENGKLTISNIFSTLMYCEETSDQETAYLAALQEAVGYQVKNGNLQILNSDGQVTLSFVPQK
jgi:heat shock protein HslJ